MMSETGDMSIEVGYSLFNWRGNNYKVNFGLPIPISHAIRNGENNPNCFYSPVPHFSPYVSGDFIGSIKAGAPVNFFNIVVNPHGSTTHTECVGHIRSGYYLKDCKFDYLQMAYVINLKSTLRKNGDKVVELSNNNIAIPSDTTALVLNIVDLDSDNLIFSGNNPIFVDKMLISEINRLGVQHLLVQIPSIDREEDQGLLEAHHEFWISNDKVLNNKTITELICLPNGLVEGRYILNLQVLNIELDVSPSNPVLYKVL